MAFETVTRSTATWGMAALALAPRSASMTPLVAMTSARMAMDYSRHRRFVATTVAAAVVVGTPPTAHQHHPRCRR